VVLVAGAYLWTFLSEGCEHPSESPSGYYGLLTDALVSGHFSLKVEPDPRLAELSDPWANYQGIPRMHDATYFHGRYYLYFGVAPVVIFFAPWHIVMHSYLSEGAAVCVFGLVGFLLGLDALRQLARSQQFMFSDGWRGLGILVWGFGTYVFVLMQSATFYTVPIASAFACEMAGLAAVGRAVSSKRVPQASAWLAIASLAWGLAVGSRPNYLLSLPALVVPLTYCMLQLQSQRALQAASATLPAALVGACLAWYNYSRFGSIFEFGNHYQFASSDQRLVNLWSTANTWGNFKAYLGSGGLYYLHFPFALQKSATIGIVPWMPFTLVGVVFPVFFFIGGRKSSPVWVSIGACALAAGAINLLTLCMLPYANDRYTVDFAPYWTFLALGVAMLIIKEGVVVGTALRRVLSILFCLLALFGIGCAWMLVFDRTPDSRTAGVAAAIAEWTVSKVESLAGIKYGPLRFVADFSGIPKKTREVLVETGGGADAIFVERGDSDQLKIGFFHRGNTPIVGIPFPLETGSPRVVRVNLGSFYPPDAHPFFRDWDKAMIGVLKRDVRVEVDGRVVLQGNSAFYPSDALHVAIGRDAGPGWPGFSGAISKPTVDAVPSAEQLQRQGWSGPVRLKLRFPAFVVPHTEPLVSSGSAAGADMIYVTYLTPRTLRFGEDSSDGGNLETPVIEFDPSKEHLLDVSYDALYQNSVPILPGIILKFDDVWKLRALRPTHPTTPYQVTFGYNRYGMGTASQTFSGSLEPLPIDPSAFTRAQSQRFQSMEFGIRFGPGSPNTPEPILSSGIYGRGDVVFVRYEGNDRIRIGVDHWGAQVVVGNPMRVDRNHVYHVRVTSAAFLPPEGSSAWGKVPVAEQVRETTHIEVELDGTIAVDAPLTAYPSNVDEIFPGVNAVAVASCSRVFSGEIVSTGSVDGSPPR
jgi:hypothetical protein